MPSSSPMAAIREEERDLAVIVDEEPGLMKNEISIDFSKEIKGGEVEVSEEDVNSFLDKEIKFVEKSMMLVL